MCRYIRAKIIYKKESGRFSTEEMNKRKILLIVSAVIVGVLVAVVVAFVVMIYMAVAYMWGMSCEYTYIYKSYASGYRGMPCAYGCPLDLCCLRL